MGSIQVVEIQDWKRLLERLLLALCAFAPDKSLVILWFAAVNVLKKDKQVCLLPHLLCPIPHAMESTSVGTTFWYHWDVTMVLVSSLPFCMIREMTPLSLFPTCMCGYMQEPRLFPPPKCCELRGRSMLSEHIAPQAFPYPLASSKVRRLSLRKYLWQPEQSPDDGLLLT